MLNVAPALGSSTPLQSFKTAFKTVAAFYGRPSSDPVLYSCLPDEITESLDIDDVQQMAERVGLQVIQHSERDCRTGNFDCPAIVVFREGGVRPLLAVLPDGSYVTELAPIAGVPLTLSPAELARRGAVAAFAFTLF